MNDLIVRSSVLKKEIKIWTVLFIGSIFINLYAINIYSRNWIELLTQMHITFILSLLFYFLIGICRSIMYGIKTLIKK